MSCYPDSDFNCGKYSPSATISASIPCTNLTLHDIRHTVRPRLTTRQLITSTVSPSTVPTVSTSVESGVRGSAVFTSGTTYSTSIPTVTFQTQSPITSGVSSSSGPQLSSKDPITLSPGIGSTGTPSASIPDTSVTSSPGYEGSSNPTLDYNPLESSSQSSTPEVSISGGHPSSTTRSPDGRPLHVPTSQSTPNSWVPLLIVGSIIVLILIIILLISYVLMSEF